MSSPSPSGADRARAAHRSRSRKQVVLAVIAAVVGFVFLVAFGLVGLLTGATGLLLFGLVFAAVCWAAAWSQYRRARPGSLPVQVRVEPPEAVRGGRIEVIVEPAGGGTALTGIEVGLICIERYAVRVRDDGDWRRRTREARELELWRPLDGGGGVVPFEIPSSAPYSHEGRNLAYEWRVEAKLPRRRRPDARQVVPLWVRPG